MDSKEFANELRPIHMAAVPGHVHVMRTLVTKLEASVDAWCGIFLRAIFHQKAAHFNHCRCVARPLVALSDG